MIRVITILVSLLLAAILAPVTATSATLAGHWEGPIQLPGQALGVLIDFTQNDDGTWAGTTDIPLQGAKGLELENISIDGANVTFGIVGPPGDPTFNGTLSEDGTKIEGNFTQGGQSFPFALERKGDAATGDAGPSTGDALEDIDAFIEETMKSWNVPGLGLAIVKDGEPILIKGYGYRDVEKKLPVTENTQFAIGSSSKAFTSLTVGMLVEQGLLDWDEPVRTYLPSFELEDDFASERMTPRDLLCHRSGLPRHDLMWYGSSATREDLFSRLKYLEPNEDFRTVFQYQNLMFMTAGYLAGQVTGTSWEHLVTDRIFDPLGMDNSNVSVDEMQRSPDYAFGYDENENEETKETEFELMPFRNIDTVGPAGSINSSAHDMARWVLLQLNNGTYGDTQIATPATMAELHRPQSIVTSGMMAQLLKQPELPHMMYGLGWFVQPYRGHELIHHGGNIDGFSALVAFMPNDNVGVVVLSNRNGTPLPIALTFSIFDRLLGFESTDWNGRYKLVWSRLEGAQGEGEALEELNRKKDTKPSHPLDDYVGDYTHPGYGKLQVTRNADALKVTFNGMSSDLEHWHFDVFRASEDPFDGLKISFLNNLNGDMDRLSIALEQTVAAIEFDKDPPREMFERDFLEQFVGEYDLMGIAVTVELKGGHALAVTVPGQPRFDLDPFMGTEFKLKGAEGASIRFIIDSGAVTEAIFIQPNGVFSAKRKT